MAIGPSAPFGAPVEMFPDTRRPTRMDLGTPAEVASVRAFMDGQGSGYGDTPCRAILRDTAGNKLADSQEVIVADGQAPGFVTFPLPAIFNRPAGGVYPELHVGNPTNAQQQVTRETPGIVARVKLDEPAGPFADDVAGGTWTSTGVTADEDPLVGAGRSIGVGSGTGYISRNPSPIAGAAQWSVGVWFRRTNGGTFQALAADADATTGIRLAINSQNRLYASIGNGTNNDGVTGTTPLVADTTYFGLASYDGTTLRLYLNGQPEGAPVVRTFVPNTTLPFRFGRSQSFGWQFTGTLDDPMICNRALADSEVADLYSGTYRKGRSARVWGDGFATPLQNTVRNPSFETGITGASSFGNTAGIAFTTPSDGVVGTKCIALTGTAADAGTAGVRYLNERFSVGDTGAVLLRGSGKVQAGAAGSIRMHAYWFSASQALAGNQTIVNVAAPAVGAWTRLEAVVAPPAGATHVYIGIYGAGMAAGAYELRFDAFQVTPVAPGTVASAVPYVDGDQAGCVWDGPAHASTSRGLQGVVNSVLNPAPSSTTGWGAQSGGVRAYHDGQIDVTTAGGGNNEGVFGTDIAVTGGQPFTHSWELATQNLAIKLQVTQFDSAGTSVGTIGTAALAATAEFTRFVQSFVLNAACVKVRIMCVTTGGAQAGVFSFRRVSTSADYIGGGEPGCDWLGAANNSASILWQVPEIYDTYADGGSATLGLPVAAPKLPAGLGAALGEAVNAGAVGFDDASDATGFGLTVLKGGWDLDGGSDFGGSGLATFGSGTDMTAESSLHGFGRAIMRGRAGLDGESDQGGNGNAVIKAEPALLESRSDAPGTGALLFSMAPQADHDANADLDGSGRIRRYSGKAGTISTPRTNGIVVPVDAWPSEEDN